MWREGSHAEHQEDKDNGSWQKWHWCRFLTRWTENWSSEAVRVSGITDKQQIC